MSNDYPSRTSIVTYTETRTYVNKMTFKLDVKYIVRSHLCRMGKTLFVLRISTNILHVKTRK